MSVRPQTTVLEPTPGWRAIDLRELFEYRELLYVFSWRDLKVRYRQTILGAVWVVGQPLVSMLIFTLLFNRVAKLGASLTVPYALFVLAGLLIWNFINSVIQNGGNSLIGSSFLISKVYFPRLVIPLANGVTSLVDFGVALLLLVPLMIWYRFVPGPELLLAPLVVLLAGAFSMGVALWIAALNVEYRDVRVVVPWILQIAMYATPVVYPLAALPPAYRPFAIANPATGIVEAFRGCLFGTPVPAGALAWSIAASLLLLASGALYFRRMERLFADTL
ncbi:MAG TPA: ABC transporter permease [Thermoanaerobaculia bacterium]|nr:ABC transporter permease [Thermoanaerobaculia bacterium]